MSKQNSNVQTKKRTEQGTGDSSKYTISLDIPPKEQ